MVTLPNIGLFDLGLGVTYLFLIYFFAFRFQRSKVEMNKNYRFFLIGLSSKIIGSLCFIGISLFYYEKGDTFFVFSNYPRYSRIFIF